ncbi:MAG TPA: hypothetical protein VGR40_12925 [Candidatus Binatus sp.]|nr:hypothetical protein [Candidatus Binatus sp.]
MLKLDIDFRRLCTVKTVGDSVGAEFLDHEAKATRFQGGQASQRSGSLDSEARGRNRIKFVCLDAKDFFGAPPSLHGSSVTAKMAEKE